MQVARSPQSSRRCQIGRGPVIATGEGTFVCTAVILTGQLPSTCGYHPEERGSPIQSNCKITAVHTTENSISSTANRVHVRGVGDPGHDRIGLRKGLPGSPQQLYLLGVAVAPLPKHVESPQRTGQADWIGVTPQLCESVDPDSIRELD
jgi:hypothetical protein